MSLLKENLARLLREKGIAPSTFARSIGFKPSTILRLLAGETQPRPGTIATIANYFGLTSNQLLGENQESIPFDESTPLITRKLVPLLDKSGEDLTSIVRELASIDRTHKWVSLPFTFDSDSVELAAVVAKDAALKPDIRVGDYVYLRFDVEGIDSVPDGAYVLAEPEGFKPEGPILRKFIKGRDFSSSFLTSTNPEWPKESFRCGYVLGVVIGRSGRL
ncbi:helix-turn-helix domain-containing protein [uncultured Parasutterella sp.]|uniref:helix-turn-helix domain-containing protein n=1 Tax=uncultured Parasutterella sp. TaxID=1263098 RepID=UPI00272C75E1|nr:helix-turn-helix transcriptional regulator [uncultured Parasutterella sp.]